MYFIYKEIYYKVLACAIMEAQPGINLTVVRTPVDWVMPAHPGEGRWLYSVYLCKC